MVGTTSGARRQAVTVSTTRSTAALITPELLEALRTSRVVAFRNITEAQLRNDYSAEEIINLRARLELPAIEAQSRLSGQPKTEVAEGDQLRKTEARGGVYVDMQERFYESQMADALAAGVDLPGSVQAGPTCGLQLLVSAFDGLQKKFPGRSYLLNPLVRPEDAGRADSHDADVPRDTSETLLNYVQSKGYSALGEVFTASDLAEAATHFGYRATVKANATLPDIKAVLARGNVAVIAMDVDGVGNPGLFGGKRAHWVAVEGTFKDHGTEYVVGTHTWDGGEYLWRADELLASTNQLKFADKALFPKSPDDLSKTLAGRLIEISAK